LTGPSSVEKPEEQIIGFLREAEAGMPIKDLCRQHGVSESSYYLWRSKFGGMSVSDAKRQGLGGGEHTPEEATGRTRLRQRRHQGCIAKRMMTAPARRLLERSMVEKGLSERRALTVVRMSASALRYEARAAPNVELREQIAALAHRHRRYGVGMTHLKLRRKGLVVNYKRVERLYQEAGLQVRRGKRKKVPVGERQPLLRPSAANEVWSIDFVFDRTAEGRVVKCLTIADDASHEAGAIEVEQAISLQGVSWVQDRLAMQRACHE